MFASGTLWSQLVSVAELAAQTGALQPIITSSETLVDHQVPFVVRRVVRMPPKPPSQMKAPPADRNPFLPYEPALHVADALPTHVCLLNKFNVVPHHLLIVTAQFEHQETMLTADDFAALWRCLVEFDGLGFYNSGTIAGASQPHKHLQIVPLPIGGSTWPVPIEAQLSPSVGSEGRVVRVERLPFKHAVVFWNRTLARSPRAAADASYDAYREMLQVMGIAPAAGAEATSSGRLAHPYNLLVHRQWMLLVPRRRECFYDMSLNALAFAGALLVQDAAQWMQLKQLGPWAALTSVAEPGSAGDGHGPA